MTTVKVTTRHRCDNLHDVFAKVGADDLLPCGTISRIGARDWQAANLIYGTKAGAAHDLARRAVRSVVPAWEDFATLTFC